MTTNIELASYCCISVCRNYKDPTANVDLYPLPKDSYERSLWCKVLNIPNGVAENPRSRVCGLHFRYKYFLNQGNEPATSQQQLPLTFFINNQNGPRIVSCGSINNSSIQQPTFVQNPVQLNSVLPDISQVAVPLGSSGNTGNILQTILIPTPEKLTTENSNLLAKGELFLDCQEETLSAAQLSVNDMDWNAFTKEVEKVSVSNPTLESSSATKTITVMHPTGSATNLAKPITIPTLTTNSYGQSILKLVPTSNTPLPANSSYSLKISEPIKFQPGTSLLSSNSGNQIFRLVTPSAQNTPVQSQVTGTPQILQFRAPNNSGSFQIVNPSGTLPQYIRIGNQTLQLFTNAAQPKTSSVSEPAKVPVTTSLIPVFNNQSVSGNSSLLQKADLNDSDLPPLPFFQPNENKEGAFPVKLERVSPKITSQTEEILPLLPRDKTKVTETILSNSDEQLSASSSSTVSLANDGEEEEIVCDVDLSGIATVYDEESSTSTNEELNTEVTEVKLKNNDVNPETVKIESETNVSKGASIPILKTLKQIVEARAAKEAQPSFEIPSPTTANIASGSFLPVIVDVMSAKDGGQAIYALNDTSGKSEEKEVEIINVPAKDIKTKTVSIPKVMHTHSIFSLQKSIPVIPTGQEIFPDTQNLFKLKTHSHKNKSTFAENLKSRLKAEDYIVNSVWWLYKYSHIPLNPPCNLCGSHCFTIDRNEKFYDKYCWTCTNQYCRTQEPIKRPKFFDRFKFCTLEDLMLLTYHWACQSDLDEVLQDVSLNVEYIWSYYQALQDLCLNSVVKRGKLGSCVKARVETSVVKLGNFFVLGAQERFNRYTRLQVIQQNEAFNTSRHLLILDAWINPDTILISESAIPNQFLTHAHKVTADPTYTDSKSNGYHILNISRYLVRNMINIFGKVKLQFLHHLTAQGFLNELQWRDRYGRFLDQAFWSIFKDIGSLNQNTFTLSKTRATKGSNLEDLPSHLSAQLLERWGKPKPGHSVREDRDIKFVEVMPQTIVIDREKKETVVKIEEPKKSYSQTSSVNKISRVMLDSGLLNILFQDLPEVPSGEVLVTPKALLGIKIVLDVTSDALEKYNAESISLGLRLSAEGFINSPVRWLVKKGFIKSQAPCYVCHNPSFLRDNPKQQDGCSWLCQHSSCKFENIFKRPHFYARFPMLPMAHMNAMVYHWTVHSEISRITSDAPMEISKLQHVWRSFQVLCSTSLRRKKVRLGGEGEMVEVAMVQFGKLYVLGVMERKTKHTLLRTFYVDLAGQIPALLKALTQWIIPFSFVIINATRYVHLPSHYNIMFADSSIMDPDDPGPHVLNITAYLLQHVSSMFGHLKAEEVRTEVMQIYLDELMWRERYGTMPTSAFYNILGDIFDLETKDKSGEKISNHLSKSQKDNACMYDKLAVRSEENGPPQENKAPEKNKPVEDNIDPASLPECRVVLKRLSKEVLKYYDCLQYIDPTYKKIGNYSYKAMLKQMKKDPKTKVFYKLCKTKVCRKNQKTYAKFHSDLAYSPPPSPPPDFTVEETRSCIRLVKRKQLSSDEDESDIDGDLLDTASNDSRLSCSSKSSVKEISGVSSGSKVRKSEMDVVFKPKEIKLEKVEPLKPTPDTGTAKPVQSRSSIRLVQRKQFSSDEDESDIDGDLLETVSNDSRLSCSSKFSVKEISGVPSGSKVRKSEMDVVSKPKEIKLEKVEPQKPMPDTGTAKRAQRAVNLRSAKFKSVIPRNLTPKTMSQVTEIETENDLNENTENELICVECGKNISIDHFMKQFQCMDCKRSVYTTSCCNSFMEHRGYLLFGKRMPRRNQTEKQKYGLHKASTLMDSYYCSCGFHSNVGNTLATHMVQCGKSTCYYHADIS